MRDERMERLWVGLMDSPAARRLLGSRLGRRLMSGPGFGSLQTRRRRLLARLESLTDPRLAADVDTVCLFIGHVKSGGTLLGAMIDAHPDALIADEVDVLDHLDAGFARTELFHLLAKSSRREAMKGRVTARRLEPYSLSIPGQWQGRHRRARVIGESRAGPTTRRLGAHPELAEALHHLADPARLRFLHVVRNPLDPIGAMVVRGGRTVEEAADDYARQAERAQLLRTVIADDHLHTVHYETLVADPGPTLEAVLAYLGLEPEPGHVAACVDLVDPDRPGERHLVDWTDPQLARVRAVTDDIPFLAPYRHRIDVPGRASRSRP